MGELDTETRNWAMGAHFVAGLAMLVAPSFGFVGPAIVWWMKKDDPVIAYHAMQAVYFQGAMTAAIWLLGILGTALSCFLIGFALYFVGLVPLLAGIVVPVLAGLKIQGGDDDYVYPVTGAMVERPPELVG